MPPKKRTKINVKKTKKKTPEQNVGADELEAKYIRSVLDVAVLKDHLALSCDAGERAQTTSIALRSRVRDMEHKLQSERLDRKDVSADLTRQYKTMQTELTSKVRRLDEEVTRLQKQLAQCQEELSTERREREQIENEKDAIIAELQNKLDNMETESEKILHDALDSLSSQLKETRLGWENRSTAMHQEYKDLLSDFGLSPLDI